MLGTALVWLATPIGRWLATAATIASVFFGWLILHDHKVRVKERGKTLAQVEDAASKLTAKGVAARRDADRPGAAQRLRRDACRDC